MEVTDASFGPPFEGAGPGWVLQVDVEGKNIVPLAAPVIAQVGDVLVERIFVKPDGDGFVGLLRTFPKNGDKLKVGYLDIGLTTTNVVYHPPVG
jgi:hypothetical protein